MKTSNKIRNLSQQQRLFPIFLPREVVSDFVKDSKKFDTKIIRSKYLFQFSPRQLRDREEFYCVIASKTSVAICELKKDNFLIICSVFVLMAK